MWNYSFCLLAAVALLACLGACGFGGWSRVGGFLSFPAFNSPLMRLTANTDRNPICWRAPTRELVASFRYLLQLAYGGRGPPGPHWVYASSLRFLRRCPRSTVLPFHDYPSLRRYSFTYQKRWRPNAGDRSISLVGFRARRCSFSGTVAEPSAWESRCERSVLTIVRTGVSNTFGAQTCSDSLAAVGVRADCLGVQGVQLD